MRGLKTINQLDHLVWGCSMTVRRIAQEIYDIDHNTAVKHVRDALSKYPAYKNINEEELDDAVVFKVNVQPNFPFVLGTRMTISVNRTEEGTAVDAMTNSQDWIMGDVFGMYDRFIIRFFMHLDGSIGDKMISQTLVRTPGGEGQARDLFWLAVLAKS